MSGQLPTPIGLLVGPKAVGSNMLALAQACAEGRLAARIEVVVSPSADCPALAKAQALGLRTHIVPYGDGFGRGLVEAFSDCEILALAGFMRLVPTEVLERFEGAIVNIHPSLLPRFGGKGMYGLKVHEAVLASGESTTGCTVHLVTSVYDEGKILLQKEVPVLAGDDAESLAKRVSTAEHQAYAEALQILIHERNSRA